MQLKKSTLVWTFIWSLFMGVTAISIGFGAAFPPLNYVASPVVCPGGAMSVDQQTYHTAPGTTVTTVTWYCTNRATGAKTELSMWPVSVTAGLVYGFLLFLVIMLGMWLIARRAAAKRAVTNTSTHFETDLAIPEAQRKELRRLREANVIGDSEYQRRVNEIASRSMHKH